MPKVCVPIFEPSLERTKRAVQEAHPWADLIELRLDYLRHPKLPPFFEWSPKPFIVTNRRKEEGGKYQGHEKRRLSLLEEAIERDVDFVDLELETEASHRQRLVRRKRRTKIILSFHHFRITPTRKKLEQLCDRMFDEGGDVAKIVTLATSYEDNLRLLSLIPYAKAKGQSIIAFCMGEKGRMSRLFAPLLGAAWTYASLNRERVSAPGQLTIGEMRAIWERVASSSSSPFVSMEKASSGGLEPGGERGKGIVRQWRA